MTPGQTVPLLLASIALEELALAHIMNAQAEKLQFALGTLGDTGATLSPPVVSVGELLDVNASVRRTLRDVIKKEMLLEFKFNNVLDLLEVLPPCPDRVVLSDGSTVRFTGLTNEGLTWNYEISSPEPFTLILFGLFSSCIFDNFVSCTTDPSVVCGPIEFNGFCDVPVQTGIRFFNVTFISQTTFTYSFTLNQRFPIGTIGGVAVTDPQSPGECISICGPVCS